VANRKKKMMSCFEERERGKFFFFFVEKSSPLYLPFWLSVFVLLLLLFS